jgi:hypothetical protein
MQYRAGLVFVIATVIIRPATITDLPVASPPPEQQIEELVRKLRGLLGLGALNICLLRDRAPATDGRRRKASARREMARMKNTISKVALARAQ